MPAVLSNYVEVRLLGKPEGTEFLINKDHIVRAVAVKNGTLGKYAVQIDMLPGVSYLLHLGTTGSFDSKALADAARDTFLQTQYEEPVA